MQAAMIILKSYRASTSLTESQQARFIKKTKNREKTVRSWRTKSEHPEKVKGFLPNSVPLRLKVYIATSAQHSEVKSKSKGRTKEQSWTNYRKTETSGEETSQQTLRRSSTKRKTNSFSRKFKNQPRNRIHSQHNTSNKRIIYSSRKSHHDPVHSRAIDSFAPPTTNTVSS